MRTGDRVAFLKESITNWHDTGSIAPSSQFLARRLAAAIRTAPNLKIVELGAGTGSVTRLLLEILPKDAHLLSVEINPTLANRLRSKINDKRCEVILGDARELSKVLFERKIEKADYIISGIPLANLPTHMRLSIYNEIKSCLKSSGAYTQFQYFLSNFAEIKKHFKVSHLAFEWRNLPPAFVYTCNLL